MRHYDISQKIPTTKKKLQIEVTVANACESQVRRFNNRRKGREVPDRTTELWTIELAMQSFFACFQLLFNNRTLDHDCISFLLHIMQNPFRAITH